MVKWPRCLFHAKFQNFTSCYPSQVLQEADGRAVVEVHPRRFNITVIYWVAYFAPVHCITVFEKYLPCMVTAKVLIFQEGLGYMEEWVRKEYFIVKMAPLASMSSCETSLTISSTTFKDSASQSNRFSFSAGIGSSAILDTWFIDSLRSRHNTMAYKVRLVRNSNKNKCLAVKPHRVAGSRQQNRHWSYPVSTYLLLALWEPPFLKNGRRRLHQLLYLHHSWDSLISIQHLLLSRNVHGSEECYVTYRSTSSARENC